VIGAPSKKKLRGGTGRFHHLFVISFFCHHCCCSMITKQCSFLLSPFFFLIAGGKWESVHVEVLTKTCVYICIHEYLHTHIHIHTESFVDLDTIIHISYTWVCWYRKKKSNTSPLRIGGTTDLFFFFRHLVPPSVS
jgi:hypothetical protein